MLKADSNKCLKTDPNFQYDEACLDILNTLNETVTVYGENVECHKCAFTELLTLPSKEQSSLLVTLPSPYQLYYMKNSTTWCSFEQKFLEHYRYGWNITEKCNPVYIKQPADSAYLPILTAFIVLFSFGTLWYMVKCIYKYSYKLRQFVASSTQADNDLSGASSTPLVIERSPSVRKHPNRIKSLDVFRGFCIILMIFVNYGGGQYWFFKHSTWNGLTIADLVFPWFMWLMGMSFSISLQRKLRSAIPRRTLTFQIIKRSLILMLFGIVINSNHNMSTIGSLRFPGVLQRIGITYLIVGLIEVGFSKRSESNSTFFLHDITVAWSQYIIVLSLIGIHTIVTLLADVPGCGRGYLGPGGLDQGGKFFNCTGGVAGLIDRSIFGEHMYKTPTCYKIYGNTQYYDPEGLLGILTSVFIVYMGVQAGRTLNTYQDVKAKVIRWILWGLVTGLIGGALCGFRKNSGAIPINKNLWSLSFVLVLSGTAFIVQSVLFVLVDILRKWGGRPFFYPGMNSIILYIGHELFTNTFPFGWKPTSKTHGTYLFMNLWGTSLWVAISIFMYKRNMFFNL